MDLTDLQSTLMNQIADASDLTALEQVRISALGKKGSISQQMKGLGQLSPDERKNAGQALNALKGTIADAIEDRLQTLKREELTKRIEAETVDVTLPARDRPQGSIHPVSHVWEEVVQIFGDLGFSVAEGPHIESDWYNFGALNIPPEHPARQEHDSFYFHRDEDGNRKVLRTHTSPVQIRTMEKTPPPIRIIAPGRTFRSDSDKTHTPMFHQFEGLVLGPDIHLGHLKWCLTEFCRAIFELDDVDMRFRASHFPFTEPSMEIDIRCSWDDGKLTLGHGDDWLEIAGSGMVHPNVIRAGGHDPDTVQGFAFGFGIDRIAMLKYGIPDLRAFFDSDLRWLRHYGFTAFDVPDLAGGLS